MCLEEHWDAEELKLDPRRAVVALWEAVLQGGWQGDERHRAVEGKLVDEYLQHEEKGIHSLLILNSVVCIH